jgi:hypothetical protein
MIPAVISVIAFEHCSVPILGCSVHTWMQHFSLHRPWWHGMSPGPKHAEQADFMSVEGLQLPFQLHRMDAWL